MKKSILYSALILTIVLASMDFVARIFFLYWSLWWFDFVMHLLAGFAGGLIAVWIFYHPDLFSPKTANKSGGMLFAVILVLFFAIAWEVFEYVHDIAQPSEGYVRDTATDISLGVLGAIISSRIATRKKYFN